MSTYELMPTTRQKSFYGKAIVRRDDDGSETLFSYGTPIVCRNGSRLTRLWDGWSATTGKHIAAFCGLNKKGYEALCTPADEFRMDGDC